MHETRKTTLSSQAFSLVEVMIAMAIIAVIASAVVSSVQPRMVPNSLGGQSGPGFRGLSPAYGGFISRLASAKVGALVFAWPVASLYSCCDRAC